MMKTVEILEAAVGGITAPTGGVLWSSVCGFPVSGLRYWKSDTLADDRSVVPAICQEFADGWPTGINQA